MSLDNVRLFKNHPYAFNFYAVTHKQPEDLTGEDLRESIQIMLDNTTDDELLVVCELI